ncbi:MAG: 50S ribosomal protein L24, partial [Pirellulaceae bacterium]|nr:50S ribosomal protein L24 [Pirellulaceae bacterium]
MSRRIRTDDLVVVIAGKDKGKQGRVLQVMHDDGRAVVEGINMQTRHLRNNPQNPAAGGRVQREAPIHISNLMPWSDADKKGVRIGFELDKDGKKIRVCRPSGKPLNSGAPV